MLEYMATSLEWTGVKPKPFLIWSEDIPSEGEKFPRPIPPDVVHQLDTLLEQAVQAIKDFQAPSVLSPILWDVILILRRTGMRFEDLAHLKVPDAHGHNGCLDQDPDGHWWVWLHHKINKLGRAHRIPTMMSDGVVEAILRQKERVKDIPNYFGENYLFRLPTQRGMLSYGSFWKALGDLAPHLTHEGQPYTITPHQFRHTIATDMIEQGVDIYIVKEFLGHSSLEMTERYVKIYLTSLKAKYDAYSCKVQLSYASEVISQVQINQLTNDVDGGWVEGKVGKLYLSPLPDGIGNCAHLAMLDACPTPPHCPTCRQLRASRRHLPVWENKAKNLLITVEALRSNPRFARAQRKHEQELQLDTLLKQAIQMMEDTQEPHILKSVFWHALLILRRTGIRFEDLAHLKAPDDHGRNGCLRQDSEGYWWLRLEHKMNKTSRDCLIPTKMSDGVVAAVQRQQERVKDIPNHFDENYLFRNQKGVLSYNTFRDALAKKLAPHLTHEGQPYTITPHQFRHTIATDMIEQGVDIYTIKEFLGHARLHTTERYIEVYHTILKARYDAYRAKKQEQEISIPALAMDQIQVSPSEDKTDGGWVNGQEGQFYLSPLPNGIGNCTHPATQEACPNPPFCPTCPKLRASARHLAAWENKANNLMITVEALRTNPAYARARQRHEQELQHTQKVVETIKQEGFWDGHLHGSR